jgi:hypothetical protein
VEDVQAFAARAVEALGADDLAWVAAPETVDGLLRLAADAAHGVQRPAAPIATFLAGIALARSGGGPAELEQAVARIRAAVPA